MKEEELSELEKIFEGFVQDHREALQLLAVYGSATRKTDVEGSDIDILALVDGTEDLSKRKFEKIKKDLKDIEKDNSSYELHIQPPKTLKKWWELALEAEPWVLTSMQDLQPIYDPEGLCDTLKNFPGQKHLEEDIKAKEMLQKGLERKEDVQQMMEEAHSELEQNIAEAAESIFRFQGKKVAEDRLEEKMRTQIVEERGLLTHKEVDRFSKVKKYDNEKTDFQKLEETFENALKFIDKASDTIRELEIQRREWIVEESFAEISKVCREALDKEIEEKRAIDEFRNAYIEEGELGEEYGELLDEVLRFKQRKDEQSLEEVKGEELYSTSAKLSDFKTAVERISSYTQTENNEIAGRRGNEEKASTSQYSALQNFQEKISEKSGDAVKASWILSIEEILETDDFTVKLLVDTEKEEKSSVEEIAEEASSSLKSETGYRIHPDVLTLSEYWRKLKAGDERLYSELRNSTTLYDPEKIFLPVKQMVEDGRLEGTREAIQEQISSAMENTLMLRERFKVQAVNKMYKATVTLGQAILVNEGLPIPVQKKVPEKMREELVKTGEMDVETYEKVKHNIRYWKDYEHGKFQEISAEDLDKAYSHLDEVSSRAETRILRSD